MVCLTEDGLTISGNFDIEVKMKPRGATELQMEMLEKYVSNVLDQVPNLYVYTWESSH